jgi:site-specific DNA recombinase
VSSRAAVYCRISDDRRGLGLGVERQQEDCHALAVRQGWTVAATYIDNDVSAYSGKRRPGYAELMTSVAAGDVDVVIAWHPDRLHRSPKELEHFIDVVDGAGTRVVTVQAGAWDLATSSGKLNARMLGNVARYESEHKSERVRRALEQNAATGRSHGRRAYGWQRVYAADGTSQDILDDAEATVVRRIADGILAGESIRSITTALNTEGVPSPTGKPWAKGMVRAVVLRERNAGLRTHRGEVVGQGTWEPILDVGRWEQMRSVLQDPQRRTSTATAAAHLLSGIARCGVCNATMRMAVNRGVPSYRCSERSCVIRRKTDVDELVVQVVTGRLAMADTADVLRPDRAPEHAAARAQVQELRDRLDLAADQYADGLIDARQLERITARLRPQLAAAEVRARVVDDSPLLDGLIGHPDIRDRWEALPLSRRRAIVDLLVKVTVDRTQQGARVFDPSAVRIEWMTS